MALWADGPRADLAPSGAPAAIGEVDSGREGASRTVISSPALRPTTCEPASVASGSWLGSASVRAKLMEKSS